MSDRYDAMMLTQARAQAEREDYISLHGKAAWDAKLTEDMKDLYP